VVYFVAGYFEMFLSWWEHQHFASISGWSGTLQWELQWKDLPSVGGEDDFWKLLFTARCHA